MMKINRGAKPADQRADQCCGKSVDDALAEFDQVLKKSHLTTRFGIGLRRIRRFNLKLVVGGHGRAGCRARQGQGPSHGSLREVFLR